MHTHSHSHHTHPTHPTHIHAHTAYRCYVPLSVARLLPSHLRFLPPLYRKTLQEQKEGKAVNTDKEEKTTKRIIEDSDSECSETEGDDNYQRILEFGG